MKIKQIPFSIQITVQAFLKPTEDLKKVEKAIKNILGIDDIVIIPNGKDMLIVKTENQKGLDNIYEKLRSRQCTGVARRLFLQNISENNTWIYYNKQAAYVNVHNICEEETNSPLGHIKIIIHTDNPEEIIDWLTPPKKIKKDIEKKRK